MDRCALFVDASYVLTEGALAVHGTRNRDSVSWDHAGLLKLLGGLSRDRSGLPLLRCYWYDTAADGNRAAEHESLADVPGVKLRLRKTRPNRREGVEAEIRKDLTALARNRAVSDVIIVSGEEDLAPVIAEVQDLGVRTILLHISADGDWAVSRALRQECDDIIDVAAGHLRPYVDLIPGAEPELAGAGYRELAPGAVQVRSPHHAIEAPAARLYGSPLAAEYDRGEPQLVGLTAAGSDQLPGQDPARFAAQAAHGPAEGVASGQAQRTTDPRALSQQYQPADASRGQLAATTGQIQGQQGFAANGFGPHDSANGFTSSGSSGQVGPGLPGTVGQPNSTQAAAMPANGLAQNGMPANGLAQNGIPANGQAGPGGQGSGFPGTAQAQTSMPHAAIQQGGMQQGGMQQGGAHLGGMHQGGAHQGGAHQGGMHQGGAHQGGAHQGGMQQTGMPGSAMPGGAMPGGGLGQTGLQQPTGQPGSAGPQSQGLAMPGQLQGMPPHAQGISGPGQHALQRQGNGPGLPPAGLQQSGLPPSGPASADQQRQQSQRQLPTSNGMQHPQDRGGQYGGPAQQSPYGGSPVPGGYPAGSYGAPQPAPMPVPPVAISVGEAVQSAHAEGFGFGEAVARDAPALWLEAVLARKPRMPSDLEARLLQGSALPIDSLLHDEVRHALRRGFWDALERSRH